jgi:hypothetical protein
MVGAVNANANKTLAEFKAAAEKATTTGKPPAATTNAAAGLGVSGMAAAVVGAAVAFAL